MPTEATGPSSHEPRCRQVDWTAIKQAFAEGRGTVGVIGLGYVGLPLALVLVERGFRCLGFDIDIEKVAKLEAGKSYIGHLAPERVSAGIAESRFEPTTDFARLAEVDAILICVPTPLTEERQPDLTYVIETTKTVANHLRPGQLVVLESTTYPGTTSEVMRPILEARGLVSGRDFLLAYSPEREDPGNPTYSTAGIPKVVGGDGELARELACELYAAIVPQVVPVSSTETAEAVKLMENIFRAVNIALVNELKLIYGRMGIDIWEVIEAARSKPFGFMPFYPGPGLGGHCIPIDPFYLAWRARQFEVPTRFIELAGEINAAMPQHVIDRLEAALSERFKRPLSGAKVLILGIAYKKNVDDVRESPAFVLWDLLRRRGAEVCYHDPHVAAVPHMRRHSDLAGIRSRSLTSELLAEQDVVLLCTDHDGVDYSAVVRGARLVVDTRNATRDVAERGQTVVLA